MWKTGSNSEPSEIVSYYRDDDSLVTESDSEIGTRVIDPGNLSTDYPHAGILNTTVFLLRYPTTPTNRNRARSRWTYYHFLGLDIEKSASRTTDPVALADTNNPTMNNSACTVCHSVMDPVAGAYQNYGEEGEYRDERGGLDSLDEFYKEPPDGAYTPYRRGDSWYRDMREPGFNGLIAPDAENSVQWLAEQIVADDRFAEATVKFWWPAIMGVEVTAPPEDENDSGFEGMLLASNAQTAEVERLAEAFRTGFEGGDPYNLKDLLVEIVLSPWFRAESVSDDDPVRTVALQIAGVERLLTPEELAWKTQAITGYSWGREPTRRWNLEYGNSVNWLTDSEDYRLLYGGIDSGAVTERADEMTATMAAVAQSHALESSCPIVQREFLLLPDENRRLFGGIDRNVSPISGRGARKIREKLAELHEKLLGATVSVDSPDVEAAFQLFVETWEHKRNTKEWWREYILCDISDDYYFEGIADDVLQTNEDGDLEYDWERAGEILDDAHWRRQGREDPVVQTWVVVLAYLLTDYRYLFF